MAEKLPQFLKASRLSVVVLAGRGHIVCEEFPIASPDAER